METIKHLLFPTDFSEAARDAFASALHLAHKLDAKITVLHIIYPEYEPMDLPVLSAKATEEKLEVAKKVMENLLASAKELVQTDMDKLPEIETRIEIGVPASSIIGVAEACKCSMIIMGTRKKHSTLEQWLGTVTAEVVGKAPCHVMVLPEGRFLQSLKVLVYATALKEADTFRIWETAQLLKAYHAIMHVVHVDTGGSSRREISMEDLEAFFREKRSALQMKFHVLESKDVVSALNAFAGDYDADLVVMASARRTFWERLFYESQSRAMVLQAKVPILVLRSAAKE